MRNINKYKETQGVVINMEIIKSTELYNFTQGIKCSLDIECSRYEGGNPCSCYNQDRCCNCDCVDDNRPCSCDTDW